MPSPIAFLSWIRSRLGLEAKFVLLAALALLLGSSIANRLVLSYERDERLQVLEEKGKLLAETIAISFTHTLLYEEIGLVQESGLMDSFIQRLLENREIDVRSVMVLDPQRRVIAHNDYTEYGKTHDDAHIRQASIGWDTAIRRYTDNGTNLLDITTPLNISTKRWGTLRLVASADRAEARIEAFAHGLNLLTVAAFAVSIAIAMSVARALARPIKRLTAAMHEVGPDFRTDLRMDRSDEIGHLQSSFLGMLGRLEEAVRDRVRLQQMLLHAERLASIGTLAAGVAHEINNPLAGLRACLRRVQREPKNVVQSRRYSSLMMDAVDRIGMIVRGMLDFARQEDLDPQPLEMRQVILDAVELTEHRLRDCGVEVVVDVGNGLPDVSADRRGMGQVFVNLILNAVDAMPDGGDLRIACALESKSLVTRVQDRGCGIAEDQISRVFDPFYTTTDAGKGTGLGLSICYRIVEEHGGRIVVQSEEGKGTEFAVYLPLPPDDGPEIAREAS